MTEETKEERELRRRASKIFTNPEDALIAFRELLEIKGIKKTKGGYY